MPREKTISVSVRETELTTPIEPPNHQGTILISKIIVFSVGGTGLRQLQDSGSYGVSQGGGVTVQSLHDGRSENRLV
jgi:hypothetical protein